MIYQNQENVQNQSSEQLNLMNQAQPFQSQASNINFAAQQPTFGTGSNLYSNVDKNTAVDDAAKQKLAQMSTIQSQPQPNQNNMNMAMDQRSTTIMG